MKKRMRAAVSFALTAAMLASVSVPVLADENEDDVVTLTMCIRNQSKYTGLQEDPVAKYIEEKLGIRINLTVDSSQTSTYNELLATKLASNDLDDIMDFGTPARSAEILNNLNRAVEAGMLLPLDDLVEGTEHLGKDSRLTLRNEYRKEYMYTDGHFYTIGGWGGMGMDQLPGAAANWIRWDLYKEAGYPEVHTDEEFLELLKKLQDENPTTPAGDTIYALGGGFADARGAGDSFVVRDYPLSKGYEAMEGNYAVYLNHATREIEAPLLDKDSFFWNGVKMYFNANQMGLIDPGSISMGSSEYNEKVKKGVYLASLNGYTFMNREEQLAAVGIEDSGYMPMKFLDDVECTNIYWENVLGCNEFAITSKCEHPEKAIEFLDWCASEEGSRIITQGAEGLAWEMEDGVPTVTDQYTADSAAGVVDMAETYGKWKYAGINGFQHIDLDSDGNFIQPEQTPDPETYSTVKKDALAYYGADSFTDYFGNYTKEDGTKLPNVIWAAYASDIGAKPDDIKQECGQINDYMYKMVFKMVYADSQEEYDSLQAECMEKLQDMGIQDVVDWYTNRMDELHTELDPIVDNALVAYGMTE